MGLKDSRFAEFVGSLETLMSSGSDRPDTLSEAERLMAQLVAQDDWLPDEFAAPDPDRFSQYMLHRDLEGRFTVLSVVWGPGHVAGPHDHTIWGVVGQLRGCERTRDYDLPVEGEPMRVRRETLLHPGQTCVISPDDGDIHDVSNAIDAVSISIHAYGGDLSSVADRRHRWDAATGSTNSFDAVYR